jgi:choloylglycine hydrolase
MSKAFLLYLFLLVSQISVACTTFLIRGKNGLAFGRNYDWITGEGILNTNQRGLFKTSMQVNEEAAISWTSKYGSITFNQYGKEFPTGGMNEKGLVVELMWLAETKYPKKDGRAALNVLQWIQYQLDNAATVDEVIASDTLLRIADDIPLHYLIADANGKAATIEFLGGKMVSAIQDSYPVLTNDTYTYSLDQMIRGNSKNDNSLERFATACSMVKEYANVQDQSPVDYSFKILGRVSQGNYTKWRIVYDITNKRVYFKTEGHSDIKSISFDDLDFSCTAVSLSFDINQDVKGDIKGKMIRFNSTLNEKSIRKAFKESAGRVPTSEGEIRKLINYAEMIKCR